MTNTQQTCGRRRGIRNCVLLTVAVTIIAAVAMADDEASEFQTLIEQRGGALVAIKYVLKNPASDQQRELEVSGIVVDPTGLVLCANTRLGGNPLGGQSLTPTEIKVLIGDDTEGLAAKVIARDTERDLGWLQITDELKAPLEHVDLARGVEAHPGSRLLSLRQLDKYFGRAVVASGGRVSGTVTKPRTLYVPTSDLDSEPGLPFFTPGGDFVGVLVVQVPDLDAQRASGRQLNARDILFILPAEQVRKATSQAKTQAAADEEEEDDDSGEEPATPAPADTPPAEAPGDAEGE